MPRFDKVLIANRGEIACRIIRCARELGLRTVAVYSEPDRTALHTLLADEAYPIGPAPSAQSYLRADVIVETALRSGAGAVHPGYGFLSENAGFARLCAEAGLVFVGPRPDAIAAMGDKIEARRIALEAGAPLVPGTQGPVEEAPLAAEAGRVGFPVMIKAAGGGGGKGMRVARSPQELLSLYRMARSEARSAFGNDAVYLERYVEAPRHIEIQVLGDEEGRIVHLFERECSVQRRHQKVIEEAPATRLPQSVRDEMARSAVEIARRVDYLGAGTLEYLVDARTNEFYFLEMNTRLQVEHPVTELTVGVDLVAEQFRIAQGLPLSFQQEDLRQRGAAIECRIYAEDSTRGFMPSPGRIQRLRMPHGPGVRNDEGIYEGYEVPIYYDPLLAKLVCWAPDREATIARTRRALGEFVVAGIATPIDYYRHVLDTELFRAGGYTTGLLEQIPKPSPPADDDSLAASVVAGLASLQAQERAAEHSPSAPEQGPPPGNWPAAGLRSALAGSQRSEDRRMLKYRVTIGGHQRLIQVARHDGSVEISVDGVAVDAELREVQPGRYSLRLNGRQFDALTLRSPGKLDIHLGPAVFRAEVEDARRPEVAAGAGKLARPFELTAPMPGKVVRILVTEGQTVSADEGIVVIEAMKMENELRVGSAARVESVLAKPGQLVDSGAPLVRFAPVTED